MPKTWPDEVVLAAALEPPHNLPYARGDALDRIAFGIYGVRRRRWPRAPRWLRVWPFQETDRALRRRVLEATTITARARRDIPAGALVSAEDVELLER